MKSKTPFKNTSYKIYNSFQSILHFKNTTLHVKKKFSPLFADNILPISMYKNIPILNCIYIPHYEITPPITNTDIESLINIGTSCFSTLLNNK